MSLPRDLEGWRGRHRGETVLVCGCGRSVADLSAKPPCVVIGVNDVGRRIDPDYLVVLNPRHQFPPERFAHIAATRAKAVFTSVADLGIAHPHQVRIGLGERGGVKIDRPGRLPYTRNSPYVAIALAMLMGARRIGLLGVDFTEGHFFGATGAHPLAREIAAIDREYGRLAEAARAAGIEIVNLSAESRLTSLPRQDLEAFLAALRPRRLRVLHLSLTNCAGAFWNLSALLNAHAPVDSRVATASSWTNQRRFPQDVALGDGQRMREVLGWADLLHFHNYLDRDSAELRLYAAEMRGKPAVLQLHSEPAVVLPRFPGRDPRRRRDLPVLVVAQKQARFYPDATPVPNAVDIEAPELRPVAPAAERPPQVVYTPTDLRDYPAEPPTCRGKGYRATVAILQRLEAAGLIRPVVRTGLQWREAMALSHGAAAKIDECVTGGYHLTSLEALSQGLATIASLDAQSRRLLCEVTGSADAELPWIDVPLDGLEARIAALAGTDGAMAEAGARGRHWMERYWRAEAVLAPYLAAYGRATGQGADAPPSRPAPPLSAPAWREGAAEEYRLAGRPAPRRSEDFPQRVRLTAGLLARRGSLAGGAAHILGNGPSLARVDLAALAEVCVIGVNASPLAEARLGRPADYYCTSDRRFLADPQGCALAASAKASMRLFAGYCDGFLPDDDIHYVRICGGDGVSDDIRLGFYHNCSVVLFAAQLALWLGASEVRLYGVEFDYDAGRFDSRAGARSHDPGIYPRVARNAAAIAAHLAARGGRLVAVGPSRLTGAFGGAAVPQIAALPIEAARRKRAAPSTVTEAGNEMAAAG